MAGVHPVPPWPGASRRWHDELAQAAAWAGDVPADLPLVVARDLNAGDEHPVLRRFGDAGLVDAHRAAGRGRPRTWPVNDLLPRLFHLDHVLARGFGVADAGTLAVPGSDHRAVWAELVPAT